METYLIPDGQNHLQFYAETGPFDQGIVAMAAKGILIIPAQHLALSRMLAGKQSPVSKNGSWVAENFVCDNKGDADVLVAAQPYAPILQDAGAATAAHRGGKEFFFFGYAVCRVGHEFSDFNYATLRERAQADPTAAIQSGVLLMTRRYLSGLISDGFCSIPPNRFAEEPLTMFLFRDEVAGYGRLLQPDLAACVPIHVADAAYAKEQRAPFARSLSVHGIEFAMSALDGHSHDLNSRFGRVSGVRFVEGPTKQVASDVTLEARVSRQHGR